MSFWKCKKCGGVIRLHKTIKQYEVFEIDAEGTKCPQALKSEIIENEDDENYICYHCGRIYMTSLTDIREIGEWVEK